MPSVLCLPSHAHRAPCCAVRSLARLADPREPAWRGSACLFVCLRVCVVICAGPVKPEDRAHSVGHDQRHCGPLRRAAAVKPLTVPERANVPCRTGLSIPRVLARVLQSHDRVEVRAKQKRTARERPVVPVTTNERHRFLLNANPSGQARALPQYVHPSRRCPPTAHYNGRRTAAHTGGRALGGPVIERRACIDACERRRKLLRVPATAPLPTGPQRPVHTPPRAAPHNDARQAAWHEASGMRA